MEDLSKNLIYLETQSPVSLKSLVNAGSRISQNQEIWYLRKSKFWTLKLG